MQSKTTRKVKQKAKTVKRKSSKNLLNSKAKAPPVAPYDLLSLLESEYIAVLTANDFESGLEFDAFINFARNFLEKNPPVGTYIVDEGLGIKLSTKENGVISLPLIKSSKAPVDMQGPKQYMPI